MSPKGRLWPKKAVPDPRSPDQGTVKLHVDHLLHYSTALVVSSLQSLDWFRGKTLGKERRK